MGPLEPGSSKFVLKFGTAPAGLDLPHLRLGKRGALVDIAERHELAPEAARAAEVVDEPTLYAGPHFRHFGHFVAESIHRLYALKCFPELRGARVALHATTRHGNVLEDWAAAVLRACGVARDRVTLIAAPTRFRTLLVPRMGRVLTGVNLIEGYADLFPLAGPIPPPHPPGARRLYLTRAGHLQGGGVLGERLIERALARAGFAIVRPEACDLPRLMGLIAGAEAVVAVEGSAIHNLDLCGRVGAAVMVVGRRKGTQDRFRHVLGNATDRWSVFEAGHDGHCLEWDARSGAASPGRRVTYLPIRPLLAAIGAFVGAAVPEPSREEAEQEVLADLGRYVMDTGATRRGTTSDEQLGRLLGEMQRQHPAGMAVVGS